MTRLMNPITIAIRKLLDQHGEGLTHISAVPLLAEIGKEEGFAVLENPGPRSEELRNMDKYEINWKDDDSIQAVAEVCGLSTAAGQSAKREIFRHKAWELQGNSFNVAKHDWKCDKAGGVSKRPTKESKNVRAVAAKQQQKKRGRPPKVAELVKRGRPPKVAEPVKRGRPVKISMPSMNDLDEFAALNYVETHGGMPNVQELLAKAQSEVAYLKQVMELHTNLGVRHSASQKAKVTRVSAVA